MTASNIERFDQYVGGIFSMLYESFPLPREFRMPECLSGLVEQTEFVDFASEMEFFYATMIWLVKTGYIEVASTSALHGFDGAVLTAKGLEVLKAIPSSVRNEASLGDTLLEASKGGTKEVIRGVVGEALSLGARMAAPYFGLPS